VMYIHVTLVPYLGKSGELKTKPTQHSVKELRSIGIQPDIIVCRSEHPLTKDMKDKIALFCNLKSDHVVENLDAQTLYEIPLMLQNEGLDSLVIEKLKLPKNESNLLDWKKIVEKEKSLENNVNIALVGKYVELKDAYISVAESLKHAGIENSVKVDIHWISSEELENTQTPEKILEKMDGILVPGGFGDRGIEGKVFAAKYARENNIPYLGICLGMQIAVIEFARNVLGLKDAHSTELNSETPYPVIDLMPEQADIENMGGTMRLGTYPCKIKEDTRAFSAYNDELVYERHRHRYEFNNQFRKEIENAGMVLSGLSPDERLVEIVELPSHKWFVAAQFHPEFKSRPTKAHPLFREFIKASK